MRTIPWLQFLRFALVGGLNTVVDFLTLNVLLYLYPAAGSNTDLLLIFNAIGFGFAVINSYFLNKYFTFQETGKARSWQQFWGFLGISVVGLLINSTMVLAFRTIIESSPLIHVNTVLDINLAKVFAAFISLAWNFIGYRLFIFKGK